MRALHHAHGVALCACCRTHVSVLSAPGLLLSMLPEVVVSSAVAANGAAANAATTTAAAAAVDTAAAIVADSFGC